MNVMLQLNQTPFKCYTLKKISLRAILLSFQFLFFFNLLNGRVNFRLYKKLKIKGIYCFKIKFDKFHQIIPRIDKKL